MIVGPAALVIGMFFALRVHRVLKNRGEETAGWVVGTLVFWPLACLLFGYKYDDNWLMVAGILGIGLLIGTLVNGLLSA